MPSLQSQRSVEISSGAASRRFYSAAPTVVAGVGRCVRSFSMESVQLAHHDVVAAAIVRGSTFLLCHRHPSRRWYPNVWDLPGGHIDPGESPIDALVRELREELGIEIDPARAVSVLRSSPKPDLDIEIWAVASWEGDIVNAEPDEHDEINWFEVADLDNLELADADVAIACRRAIEHFALHPPGKHAA